MFEAAFEDFLEFSSFELLGFFEFALFIREFTGFVGIDAVEALLEIVTLFGESDVAGAQFVEARLVDCAVDVEDEGAVAFDVMGGEISGDLVLIGVAIFEGHMFVVS